MIAALTGLSRGELEAAFTATDEAAADRMAARIGAGAQEILSLTLGRQRWEASRAEIYALMAMLLVAAARVGAAGGIDRNRAMQMFTESLVGTYQAVADEKRARGETQ